MIKKYLSILSIICSIFLFYSFVSANQKIELDINIKKIPLTSVGTYGSTFKIKERDAIDEMMEQASKVDLTKMQRELEQKMKNYTPPDWQKLTKAKKSYSYTIDMTYTLEYDIPNYSQDGKYLGVLYPKGYKYNPLHYLQSPMPTLVVFNGKLKEEVAWVYKRYPPDKPLNNTMLLITEGKFFDLMEKFKRPIYYLPQQVAEKFKLQNTISVISQQKDIIKVDVIEVKRNVKHN